MPILNIQLQGQAKQPDGSIVQIAPSAVLIQRGPVVQVSVTVKQAVAAQILQSGGTVPAPVTGLALIDTGASSTCIDEDAAKKMNLPVIDVVNVSSASHASTPQNVYTIQIEVVGLPITVAADRAIGAALNAQGLLAIIGRDVLQHAVLVHNGTMGVFSLAI